MRQTTQFQLLSQILLLLMLLTATGIFRNRYLQLSARAETGNGLSLNLTKTTRQKQLVIPRVLVLLWTELNSMFTTIHRLIQTLLTSRNGLPK